MRQLAPQSPASRRGQPLMVYVALIVGWIVLRIFWWDSPLGEDKKGMWRAPASTSFAPGPGKIFERPGRADKLADEVSSPVGGERAILPALPPIDRRPLGPAQVFSQDGAAFAVDESELAQYRASAGHQLLWLAAMARLPVPRALAEAAGRNAYDGQAAAWLPLAKARDRDRWSLDAWVFLRESSVTTARATGPRPSYGKSQLGAVIRYRLAEGSDRRPGLYARHSRALAGDGDIDFAAGIAADPIAGLPLRIHAELRATQVAGRTDLRPAAFATAGMHRDFDQGFQLRGYAQAGYVGGDFATAFVDGQLVADREVARFDLGRLTGGALRLGGGSWGGAQKGAARLDVGPSADVLLPMGDVPLRLSVDYRLRVVGDAEPDSGLALTLSSGF